MRRFSLVLALVASFALAGTALAAPASTKLKTFAEGGSVVTVNNGTVTINNSVVDGTVSYNGTPYNDGGVYIGSKSQSSKPLNQVAFSFTSTGFVSGGAPRFSLPIDTDHNGTVDGYAFLDAIGCGGTADVSTVVSTSITTCAVFFDTSYANWAAFAAAHPTYRTAPGAIPFIIADGYSALNAIYVVSDIVLR